MPVVPLLPPVALTPPDETLPPVALTPPDETLPPVALTPPDETVPPVVPPVVLLVPPVVLLVPPVPPLWTPPEPIPDEPPEFELPPLPALGPGMLPESSPVFEELQAPTRASAPVPPIKRERNRFIVDLRVASRGGSHKRAR
jgi:hypothetical protein